MDTLSIGLIVAVVVLAGVIVAVLWLPR